MTTGLQIGTLVVALTAAGFAGYGAFQPEEALDEGWMIPGVTVWGTPDGDANQYMQLSLSLANPTASDVTAAVQFIGEGSDRSCAIEVVVPARDQVTSHFFRNDLYDLDCLHAGTTQYAWNGYLLVSPEVRPQAHIITEWPSDGDASFAMRSLHAFAVDFETQQQKLEVRGWDPEKKEAISRG